MDEVVADGGKITAKISAIRLSSEVGGAEEGVEVGSLIMAAEPKMVFFNARTEVV
jgi:hypothetical protein